MSTLQEAGTAFLRSVSGHGIGVPSDPCLMTYVAKAKLGMQRYKSDGFSVAADKCTGESKFTLGTACDCTIQAALDVFIQLYESHMNIVSFMSPECAHSGEIRTSVMTTKESRFVQKDHVIG